MAVVYRTDGAWGSGLGRVLTAAEVDGNFWSLVQRVLALETTPVTAVSIESIDYASGGITINLNNGDSFGPFLLPVATMNYRDMWTNNTLYHYLDLVNVPTIGLFLVLVEHTTPALPATFDREATDVDLNDLYRQVSGVPRDIAYDFAMNVIGAIPNDASPMQIFLADRAVSLPAGLTGSRAYLLTGVTTHNLVMPIELNGVQIGTVTFSTGGSNHLGVFAMASTHTLAAGDRLVVRSPGILDATAADLAITISGIRADL